MTAQGTAILTDPHPCGHIVYPYTDEKLLAQAVCLFASAGLSNDEGVILIMAADHCDAICRRLESEGFQVAELEETGQLQCIVAEELMSTFVVGNTLDERLFRTIARSLVERARASTGKGPDGLVRVFGEMVNLLWRTNISGAARLEELWNEAIEDHSISLMCTYSLEGPARQGLPESLMAPHTHAI